MVQRSMGESIIEAAEHRKGAKSHFYTLDHVSDYYQSDAEDEDEFEVFRAEHAPKMITRSRQKAIDKVTKPPHRDKDTPRPDERSNQNAQPSVEAPAPYQGMGTHNNPQESPASPEVDQQCRARPLQDITPVPVDARQPRVVELLIQDVEMGDVTHSRHQVNRNQARTEPQAATTEKTAPKPCGPVWQSQISSQIEDKQVVSQILNTPVTLRIREVLATLREVSDQLVELVKRKNPCPVTAAVANVSASAKDTGKLIRISLQLENKRILGIIDTGSELNVINRNIVRDLTEAPVDPKCKVTMNDANGGAGNLNGHISDVLLKCRSVETYANLYIGVVFKSPVQSGFFAQNGKTETGTGPRYTQDVKKPDRSDRDRSQSVTIGLLTGLDRFRPISQFRPVFFGPRPVVTV
ncbi:hypothetical protein Hypma_008175 [Hypsizygus marmoreus]|uniref:Uncharacterized protein n=1 Tax=Hypsizygus marmoreus TaxID=39966 RepID=A0A369JQY7_HYPMA|nr:hypothetical protein Hypma_008175 [Hypsizygus marmoreus]